MARIAPGRAQIRAAAGHIMGSNGEQNKGGWVVMFGRPKGTVERPVPAEMVIAALKQLNETGVYSCGGRALAVQVAAAAAAVPIGFKYCRVNPGLHVFERIGDQVEVSAD